MSTWKLDPVHSEIGFKVKHMMITNVSGAFKEFDVEAKNIDDDLTDAQVSFNAATNSISTNNADRDTHLKSGDFFDAEKYPELKFASTGIKKIDGENYELLGNMTIKGVTKPVKLNVEFGGIGKDPWGNEKAGFSLKGKIKRTDWNLNWNAALETGGILVSEDVKISAEVQLVKDAA